MIKKNYLRAQKIQEKSFLSLNAIKESFYRPKYDQEKLFYGQVKFFQRQKLVKNIFYYFFITKKIAKKLIYRLQFIYRPNLFICYPKLFSYCPKLIYILTLLLKKKIYV